MGCGRCSHCWSWPRFLLSRPRHLGVGVSGPADGNDAHRFITVMTRNLDEGTDFTPLFTATSVPTFLKAATAIFHEMVAGDISARAERDRTHVLVHRGVQVDPVLAEPTAPDIRLPIWLPATLSWESYPL